MEPWVWIIIGGLSFMVATFVVSIIRGPHPDPERDPEE